MDVMRIAWERKNRHAIALMVLVVILMDVLSYMLYYFSGGEEITSYFISVPAAILMVSLSFIRPAYAFFLMILLIGNTHYFRLFSLKISEIICISLFFSLLFQRRLVRLLLVPHLVLLYFAITGVALLYFISPERPALSLEILTSPPMAAISILGRFAVYGIMVWVAATFMRHRLYLSLALKALLLGCFIHSLFALFQYGTYLVWGDPGSEVWFGRVAGNFFFPRITGLMSDPGGLTLYMNVAIFATLAAGENMYFRGALPVSKQVLMGVFLTVQILTFSVLGYIALLMGLAIYYFRNLAWVFKSLIKAVIGIVLSIVILSVVVGWQKVQGVFDILTSKLLVDVMPTLVSAMWGGEGIEGTGIQLGIRSSFDKCYLKMFSDNPLIGVGIGQGAYFLPQYAEANIIDPQMLKIIFRLSVFDIWPALNNYLTLLAETGIVGFTLLALFFFTVFIKLLFKTISNEYLTIRRGLFSIMVTYAFSLYASNALFSPCFELAIGIMVSLLFREYGLTPSVPSGNPVFNKSD